MTQPDEGRATERTSEEETSSRSEQAHVVGKKGTRSQASTIPAHPIDQDEPTAPPPNEDGPWWWTEGQWWRVITDTGDGVPESLTFPKGAEASAVTPAEAARSQARRAEQAEAALARIDAPSGDTHQLVVVYRRVKDGTQRVGELTCIHCGRTGRELRESEAKRDVAGDQRDDDAGDPI